MKSAPTAIPGHLRLLRDKADLITQAYASGSVNLAHDNKRDIAALAQAKVFLDIGDDQFRLTRYIKRHLDDVMQRRRNYAVGDNLREQVDALEKLAQSCEMMARQGNEAARTELGDDFEDIVFEIAQDIDTTMAQLRALVDTEFGDVSSFADKSQQNHHYLKRVEQNQETFLLIEDAAVARLIADNPLLSDQHRVYRRQLLNRLPEWRLAFMGIAEVLREHVHQLRRVEPKARALRRLAFHLQRDRTWDPPGAPADDAMLADWMRLSEPVRIHPWPRVSDPAQEEALRQIAERIPLGVTRLRAERHPGGLTEEEAPQAVELPEAVWRRGLQNLLDDISAEPVSVMAWWQDNPIEIELDLWLIYVRAEAVARTDAAQKTKTPWPFVMTERFVPHGPRDGVLWIEDITLCRRA